MPPAWSAHLPAGTGALDLLADRSLPGSWTRRWAADPHRPVLWEDGAGWTSAAQLEERTRTVAGRYAAAGLLRGDRLVLSAAASVDLVVAHVAALRLGLVVVPVNGAYGEREVSGIVADCRPAAAVVDDAARGGWIEAAAGPVVVTGPDVALPDGRDAVLDDLSPDDPGLLVSRPARPGRRRARCSATATCWPARRPSGSPGAGCPRTGWCLRCRCSMSTASASGCTAR